MSDWGSFLSKLLEKFDFMKLMICVFVVLALMLVPGINYLSFIMPLDTAEKWIKFAFALVATYLVQLIIVSVWKLVFNYFKYKPRKVLRMWWNYGGYINIFFSNEIKEYTLSNFNLDRYDVPQEIIEKLHENNIIEYATYYPETYRLTKKARKKLNYYRTIYVFIDNKIINRKKTEDENNG